MRYSRRDFGLLFPALAAATASAQTTQGQGDTSVEKLPRLETKVYIFDQLPVTTKAKTASAECSRAKTHTGFKLESHQSEIAPGEVNHPPHQHALGEEMMLVREGLMELTVADVP